MPRGRYFAKRAKFCSGHFWVAPGQNFCSFEENQLISRKVGKKLWLCWEEYFVICTLKFAIYLKKLLISMTLATYFFVVISPVSARQASHHISLWSFPIAALRRLLKSFISLSLSALFFSIVFGLVYLL